MENITKQQYETKENAIIQFSASWCGPCKTLTPILESLAKENNLEVYKVDIGKESELAREKGIRSIPYVEFLKEGKVVETFVGAKPKDLIQESIKNVYVL
jgi:thioredoxin 1